MSQEIIGVNINDFVRVATDKLGNEIFDTLVADDSHFNKFNISNRLSVKFNHYNLMLHDCNRKYKIWIGINARIAEENYNLSLKCWPNHPVLRNTIIVKGDGFYVESIPFVPGYTFRDVFLDIESKELDRLRSIDDVVTMAAKFIKDFFISDYDGMYYCCTDIIPDNLVLTGTNDLILIDFDHVVKLDSKTMYDIMSSRFFKYLYSYDGDAYHKWWLDYREKHSYEEAVERLRREL